MPADFATRLLDWYDRHGRHDLPWQKNRSLYRVWVSEIMLQQTQVKTVIPYFRRFMQRFPSLKRLAAASVDEVLQYWAGLGYYSRARNLHKAAVMVTEQHGGRIPRTLDALMQLPGIGRSTAAAILSQALDQRQTILDGNVKRVLARYHGVPGWPGDKAVERELWRHAEQHTPARRNADYTQAIMDLGASLCSRSRPDCGLCPLGSDCHAFRSGQVEQFPGKKSRKALPVRQSRFLLLVADNGSVLLEKRPPTGVWGGLWSLPEIDMGAEPDHACRRRWGLRVLARDELMPFRHTFSHYHLDIAPCLLRVEPLVACVQDSAGICWLHPAHQSLPAVAAPVARILRQYTDTQTVKGQSLFNRS